MASPKNSDRRKRKYGDGQKARTARNKANAKARAERRQARLVERTQALIGQHVQFRSKDNRHPLVGTVTDVLRKGDEDYPEPYDRRKNPTGSKRRHGAFVKIRTPDGHKKVSRHRIKLVRKEQ